MNSIDVNFIRSQFPAFSSEKLKDKAFFDNAGGSYCNKYVINRLNRFYTERKMQPYAPYTSSQLGGEEMDEAYLKFAEILNVKKDNIHFGPSTSQNTYVLSNALREMNSKRKKIIVTNQDHEANSGVWRKLSNYGYNVVEWTVDSEKGLLKIEDLNNLIDEETLIVAFPHCSNILGYINPVKKICDLIRSFGSLSCVDGVSFVPHGFPDLKEFDPDIYLFSTYKTYGPHLGVMCLSDKIINTFPNQGHFFNEKKKQKLFYPAGPDHAQIASLVGISDYINAIYNHHFDKKIKSNEMVRLVNNLKRNHEKKLLKKLLTYLNSREIDVLGTSDLNNRVPTISINLKKSAKLVAKKMFLDDILTDGGDFYAVRLLKFLGVNLSNGVLRLSFVHYNSIDEIEKLIYSLKKHL